MEESAELCSPSDKLVLIVEDDESMLDLTQTLVKTEGFRVDYACNGLQALEKTAAVSPDLVLLDLMLPGTGGYEVVRELQARGFGHIPVIVLTARHMDTKSVDAILREPNVREFILKPPPQAKLAALLHYHAKYLASPHGSHVEPGQFDSRRAVSS